MPPTGSMAGPLRPQRSRRAGTTAQACAAALGPAPPAMRACAQFACRTRADCSGAGACNATSGTCVCDARFVGAACDISLGPCGAAGGARAAAGGSALCCATGVVDRRGACCNSGKLLPPLCDAGPVSAAVGQQARPVMHAARPPAACAVAGGARLAAPLASTCRTGVSDGPRAQSPHVLWHARQAWSAARAPAARRRRPAAPRRRWTARAAAARGCWTRAARAAAAAAPLTWRAPAVRRAASGSVMGRRRACFRHALR